ncbi:APC family permease [Catenulispora rubra]|uniref:APC family permease n=1 Tax=Catenulispora rubra TaxID=280293 RepID=UPI00189277EF|nr:APC family permease [Catenulispora rubra]
MSADVEDVEEPATGPTPALRGRPTPDLDDEFGLGALFALAFGGAIGSGWLLGGYHASSIAGSWAWLSWLIGGALMLVVALVMVELGRHAPENGGLVSWPYQSSGPFVGTIVAAALWIFYALNPATESVAVVQAFESHALYDYSPESSHPTWLGILVSAAIMVPLVATNLFALRVIRQGTVLLSAFKVFVPVAVVFLLLLSGFDRHAISAHHVAHGYGTVRAVVSAVTVGGVVFAYVGFQGPLDLAGQVRRDVVRRFGVRVDEGVRLRVAVLGTISGSIILYTLLQLVFLGHTGWQPGDPASPYTRFAVGIAATGAAMALLLRIDTIVSPASAGIVYVLLLSREVEGLAQMGVTDRRLARPRRLFGRGRPDMSTILLVNLIVGWLSLLILRGDWVNLVTASGVLTLFIYALPAVSLMALRRHYAETASPRFRISGFWWIPAWLGFVGASEVLYWSGWPALWRGMTLLGVGVVLLLVLPVASRWAPARIYDADNQLSGRWPPIQRAAFAAAVPHAVLVVGLLVLSRSEMSPGLPPTLGEPSGSLVVAMLTSIVFAWSYRASVGYMSRREPILREPTRTTGSGS